MSHDKKNQKIKRSFHTNAKFVGRSHTQTDLITYTRMPLVDVVLNAYNIHILCFCAVPLLGIININFKKEGFFPFIRNSRVFQAITLFYGFRNEQ